MSRFSISRIAAMSGKEWLHILYDPRSLLIVCVMPILQLVMFGYAMNMEIQNINLAVFDYDDSAYSRELIRKFTGSEFFTVTQYRAEPTDIHNLFLQRKAHAVLLIEKGTQADMAIRHGKPVQLLIDAADPNAANLVRNYCERVITSFNQARGVQAPVEVRQSILYNPELESAYNFVPGLVALILVMICALLTSITISREKESGTLEQLMVTPVRPLEVIVGKIIPYIVLSFVIGSMIVVVGILLFGVPFRGDILTLAGLSTLYILTALSLGLLISAFTNSQQVAMMMAILLTMLPTIMLSGFIFPVSSMPRLLQFVTYIVPAKYYLYIVRGVMLKGNTAGQLMQHVLALSGFSVVMLAVAIRKFSGGRQK